MSDPFSVLTYWDQGKPKIIIWSQKGLPIPQDGPSVWLQDGKIHVRVIVGQPFDLKLPELNAGEEMAFVFESFDPKTGQTSVEEKPMIWKDSGGEDNRIKKYLPPSQ